MAKLKYLFFLSVFSLHAVIIETNQMEDALPHITDKTWVLFDVDNTLIMPTMQVGRSEWFHHEIKKLMAKGLDLDTAEDLLLPEWDRISQLLPVQTPEPELPSLVKKIQASCATSFALTARYPHLSALTLKQLKKLGFDFSKHAPTPEPLTTIHPILWEEGVLFVSWLNSKGVVFREYLQKSKKLPAKVIFIDDNKRHLMEMETELLKLGVDYVGVHYTKTFERPFEPEIAEREYELLNLTK